MAPYIQAVRDVGYAGALPSAATLAYVFVAAVLMLLAGRALFAALQDELAVLV